MPAPITLPAGTPYFGSADVDLFRTTTRGRPIWVFGSAIDLTDYEVELDVRWGGGAFQVRTTDSADALNGRLARLSAAAIDVSVEAPPENPEALTALRWEITALAIAAMPLGRIARGRIYLIHKEQGFRRLHRDLFFIVH